MLRLGRSEFLAGGAHPRWQRRVCQTKRELRSHDPEERAWAGGRVGLALQLKGKGGKVWRLGVRDRRIAKAILACQERPGQELFQYVDDMGGLRDVTSSDVNAYLKEISGEEITAKDFRTWHGTVLAALALRELATFDNQSGAKRNIKATIQRVAVRLGNTETICRKCYVHPEILTTYIRGSLLLEVKDRADVELAGLPGLEPGEAAVLALLHARLRGHVVPALYLSLSPSAWIGRCV